MTLKSIQSVKNLLLRKRTHGLIPFVNISIRLYDANHESGKVDGGVHDLILDRDDDGLRSSHYVLYLCGCNWVSR